MSIAQEITAQLQARTAAIAARNVDAVLEQIAPDVVSFDVGRHLVQVGAKAVRDRLTEWFSGFATPIHFDVQNLAVHGAGNIAFSHALVHITGTTKTGNDISMWVRSTIGWEQQQGRWLAIHEHMSDPMDFETGKTLTNLKPS